MYDKKQEKYKNSVFQVLKICKIRTLERLAKGTLCCAIA